MKNTIELSDLTNLVESYLEGEIQAIEWFKSCEIKGEVVIRTIDSARIADEDGDTVEIKRYECYVDSGSVDYFYFQTKTLI